jgi:hypothetical protein
MTYNKIRRAKLIDDLAKRDGFQTMDEYRYNHWGKARCEYYVKIVPQHPLCEKAKNALEWAENNK